MKLLNDELWVTYEVSHYTALFPEWFPTLCYLVSWWVYLLLLAGDLEIYIWFGQKAPCNHPTVHWNLRMAFLTYLVSVTELGSTLKPQLLHLLLSVLPDLRKNSDAVLRWNHQIRCIFWMQGHGVTSHNQRLAEAGQHQHIETIFLCLVEGKDTLPAREDRSTHLYGFRVLHHHVHDGDS